MQDSLTTLRTSTWPVHVYWACQRCKHGKFKPDKTPTPPHTHVTGCRYNREKIPPGGIILSPDDSAPLASTSPTAPPAAESSPAASSTEPNTDKSIPVAEAVPVTEPIPAAQTAEPVQGDQEGKLDPDMKMDSHTDYIEPSFDIRMLRQKLLEPSTSTKERLKLLLGLHYKFRHLPAT